VVAIDYITSGVLAKADGHYLVNGKVLVRMETREEESSFIKDIAG
jgi:hypothetical protein